MSLLRLPSLKFGALVGYRLNGLRTLQPSDVPDPADPDQRLRCAACAAERGLDESMYVAIRRVPSSNPQIAPYAAWLAAMIEELPEAAYVGSFDKVGTPNAPVSPYERTKNWGLCAGHVSQAAADLSATKEGN